jgi:hypothetical protein
VRVEAQGQALLDDAVDLGADPLAQRGGGGGGPAVGLDLVRDVEPVVGQQALGHRRRDEAGGDGLPPGVVTGVSRSTKPKPRTCGRKTPVGSPGRRGGRRRAAGGRAPAGAGGRLGHRERRYRRSLAGADPEDHAGRILRIRRGWSLVVIFGAAAVRGPRGPQIAGDALACST